MRAPGNVGNRRTPKKWHSVRIKWDPELQRKIMEQAEHEERSFAAQVRYLVDIGLRLWKRRRDAQSSQDKRRPSLRLVPPQTSK